MNPHPTPQELIEQLSTVAMTRKTTDKRLAKVARSTQSRIQTLLRSEPQHTIGDLKYKELYKIVWELIIYTEQHTTSPDKASLKDLKSRLKAAFNMIQSQRKTSEAVLTTLTTVELAAKVAAVVGDIPVPLLAPIKPVAAGLLLIIELAKTAKSNKQQASDLASSSSTILNMIMKKMKDMPGDIPESIKSDIDEFTSTLHTILIDLYNLQTKLSCISRFLLVKDTKDDLINLKYRIERASTAFMMSSILSTNNTMAAISKDVAEITVVVGDLRTSMHEGVSIKDVHKRAHSFFFFSDSSNASTS